jgi:hypothetical protein
MSEHDHQPVTIAGLLLLAAIALIFLIAIWLIGMAFAQKGTEAAAYPDRWNQLSIWALL